MAKVKAPQKPFENTTGDFEIDKVLSHYRAAKRLMKDKKGTAWQMAAAAASSRRLLIGDSRVFKRPK